MCTRPFYKRVDNINGCRCLCLPCGECEECLRQKQSDYMVRIAEELKQATKACFVTLTYSPESVPMVVDPENGEVHFSVCKNHVVNWLKRFRAWYVREYGLNSPLRYFLTSEYGPETLRPHYHLVVINHDKIEFAHALNDWRKRFGYVKCKDIDLSNPRSAVRAGRYLGKYCSKGVFENPLVRLGKVEKSFRLFSKHFGLTYVYRMRGFHLGLRLNVAFQRFQNHIRTDEYMDYIIRNSVVYVVGDSYPHHMPRYYKEKIYGSKNPFSCQKEDYLFRMAAVNDSRQLAAIQSSFNCSPSEAYHKKDLLFREEILCRAKSARSKIVDFYKHSQL